MSFGIYVHIPFCLQTCSYCDFATYESSSQKAFENYLQALLKEIDAKAPAVLATNPDQPLTSIYFGGGTPSLFSAQQLDQILKKFKAVGFNTTPQTEVTLEINPGTVDQNKLASLIEVGFNRFSVGVQTFSPTQLTTLARKHSVEETRTLLTTLKKSGVNYSADLLFALPNQSLEQLEADLKELLTYSPNHISAYCLTLPQRHALQKNRPDDLEQEKMLNFVAENLEKNHFHRYELSNFSKAGFESRHNGLYWNDSAYWGLGLSAHSYLNHGDWGTRFWNPAPLEGYLKHVEPLNQRWNLDSHDNIYKEVLQKHQALTDFCHTSLRTDKGLDISRYLQKFGRDESLAEITRQCEKNTKLGLLEKTQAGWRFTNQGYNLSNQVFIDFTFLPRANF